jgi:ATP-binding protein involved in chromosome partitioning
MSKSASSTTPTRIGQRDARHLEIAWADGEVGLVEVRALRLACACAVCIDEWTGEERLDPSSVPEDVHPTQVRSVGRYALQIDWSDGHTSGIYPFERLRALMDGRPDPKARTRTA